MTERRFELKLADGRVVAWTGSDGLNASERYVDCHRDATVIAWRDIRHGLFPGVDPSQIKG